VRKLKVPFALVAVEVRDVAVEVGLEDVEPPVAVVVGGGHAHAGLLEPVFVIGEAGLDAALREAPVAVVSEVEAGRRIAGHVNVRQPRFSKSPVSTLRP